MVKEAESTETALICSDPEEGESKGVGMSEKVVTKGLIRVEEREDNDKIVKTKKKKDQSHWFMSVAEGFVLTGFCT